MYAPLFFWMKFNSEQLLLKQFLDMTSNFGSVQLKVNLLSYFDTIFETYQAFEPHSSNPGGDKTRALNDFFVRNSILNNFYLNNFLI